MRNVWITPIANMNSFLFFFITFIDLLDLFAVTGCFDLSLSLSQVVRAMWNVSETDTISLTISNMISILLHHVRSKTIKKGVFTNSNVHLLSVLIRKHLYFLDRRTVIETDGGCVLKEKNSKQANKTDVPVTILFFFIIIAESMLSKCRNFNKNRPLPSLMHPLFRFAIICMCPNASVWIPFNRS